MDLLKVEFINEVPSSPCVPPPAAPVEARHDWVIRLAWWFISEIWEYERKPEAKIECDHEARDRSLGVCWGVVRNLKLRS